MKRFTAILLALLFVMTMLSGCGQIGSNEKISVVCTIFPQYDWVRQILGDKADNMDLTLLLDNRIDLHNFQPSVDDIVKISSCDLFIYVGGESDDWVDDALKEATNKDMVVINLLEVLGDAAKIEEVKEGMEDGEGMEDKKGMEDEEDYHSDEDRDENHEYEGSHEDEYDHDEEHEVEYDEHVWLSLKNAQIFCEAIADALSALDAKGSDVYRSNLTAYIDKLSALDSSYQAVVNAAPVKTLLFGDRFPFRYLVDDYGMDYHAAFVGCSAETEASFETIIFLAGKVDELSLKNIMATESSDQSITKTIRNNTAEKNQQILVMDAMQSVAKSDVQSGTTYLSIMENNLNVLKEALQ
ncbi:MAG: metal ABC transporter substrate-binding protein [Oscillospiraceae bacterium]|nr:metal ABC transporter substrate-binding protein [Oscillospiraceae bacterium]